MINKKAFEMQFNWIFVLVAGAAILLFFTVVIVKQKNIAEISTKSTVLKNVEAIIAGTGVSTYTTHIIPIPYSSIEISCGRVSFGGVSKQYQSLILFAPSLINGDKLITQTLDFSVPYRATNLLYVTSPNLRYIIEGKSNLAKEINKSLPSALKKEFYPLIPQTIRDENNYKVRFIFFGEINQNVLTKFGKMSDSDVTAVRVDGDNEKGTIEFYQKSGISWSLKGESSYIGKNSMIGAIYTDTLDMYECNMRNAFSKLNLVNNVYAGRTNKLISSTLDERSTRCNDVYRKALNELNKISDASSKLKESSSFDHILINDITNAAKALADDNKQLQLYSCTLIY